MKRLALIAALLCGCADGCRATWSYEHCAKACGALGVYRYDPGATHRQAECVCKNGGSQ